MKSFTNYITTQQNINNYNINYINECLANNVPIINENVLLINQGQDIDRLWYKLRKYMVNEYNYYTLNESRNNLQISINEANSARDLLIYFAEQYKFALLNDYTVCESLLNNDNVILEELQLTNQLKEIWTQGKDKVKEYANNIKTKIEAINKFIQDIISHSIKTIKDIANRAVDLIESVHETLADIAKKLGCNDEFREEIANNLYNDLKNNKDVITQTNVYESLGKRLQNQVDEGVVDWYKNAKEKGKKWWLNTKIGKFSQTPLCKLVFGLLNWGLWMVVIPGIVGAICPPGALIVLIVPAAIKICWNLKKLSGLRKQFTELINRWNVLSTRDKLFNALLIVFNCWAIYNNSQALWQNSSALWDEIVKAVNSGEFLSKLFTSAGAAGIEPDSLTTFGAACIKKIANWDWDTPLEEYKKEFIEGFKKTVDGGSEVLDKLATETAETTKEAVDKINAATDERAQSIQQEIQKYKGTKASGLWSAIKSKCQDISIEDLKSDKIYKIVVSGTATDKANWIKQAKAALPEDSFDKLMTMVNSSVNNAHSNSGSATILQLSGGILKELKSKGLSIGAGPDGGQYGIIGEIAKQAFSGNVSSTVKTFLKHMLLDLPLVDLHLPKGEGFIVRLGNENQKDHFEYHVTKNDIITQAKIDEIKNDNISSDELDKIKEEYNKIIEIMTNANEEFLKQITTGKNEEDVKEQIKDASKDYKKKISELPITILCGTKLTEKTKENLIKTGKREVKESFVSLYDYIINEKSDLSSAKNDDNDDNTNNNETKNNKKYSIDEIKQNFTDLRDYLDKIGLENNGKNTDGRRDYSGNTQMLLESIFSLSETAKTNKLKFTYDKDGKYKPTPYETISKRTSDGDTENDYWTHLDIEQLAYSFAVWKSDSPDKAYISYANAFEKVIMLKRALMDNGDYTKIITIYSELINNLLEISSIANDVKDKEWKPREEWAPLKFDESKIDDDVVNQIEKTEDNMGVAPTMKGAEDNLKDHDAPVPQDDGKQEDTSNTSDESNDTEKEEKDDGKSHPILLFVNCYGKDLGAATKKGPRPELYSMKGLFHSLLFQEYKNGMAINDIQSWLGEMLYDMVKQMQTFAAESPIVKKKNWWKDKIELNPNVAANDERKEFGHLTNGDIVDILNSESADKYIKIKSSISQLFDSNADKQEHEKLQKDFKDKLNDPDDETKKLVKEIDPDAIDDNTGKIKRDKIDMISSICADYKFSKNKAEKADKGLFGKIKKFVRGLLGLNNTNKAKTKEKAQKYNKLINHLNGDKVNDNLNEDDKFIEACFGRTSLFDYISEHKQ